ncbi:putative Der1 like family [Trypanosoma vivax]|nr:putative Der1 like family [Trypanosoma vivax]
MAQSFETWFRSLGPVTRRILVASVAITMLSSVRAVPFPYLLLDYSALKRFELWRPATAALFFGNFSFPWLISIAMFVSYLSYNEENDFKGKSGDYAWMIVVLITGLTIGGLSLSLPVTSGGLLMSLCWIFCKRHPELRMALYSFEFNATTFPWVLLAFHFILGQNIVEDVLGIVVGHMFFFVKDLLPLTNPIDPLRTPSWFLRHVLANDGAQRVGSIFPQSGTFVRQSSGRAAEERSRSHRWGPGRALGGM